MIYIGIDVAKDKHDCFITNIEGEVLVKPFTIPNNLDGFNDLFQKICSVSDDFSEIKEDWKLPATIISIFWGFLLIKVFPPLSLIRYIQICIVKVLALDRRKRIRLMPIQLLL